MLHYVPYLECCFCLLNTSIGSIPWCSHTSMSDEVNQCRVWMWPINLYYWCFWNWHLITLRGRPPPAWSTTYFMLDPHLSGEFRPQKSGGWLNQFSLCSQKFMTIGAKMTTQQIENRKKWTLKTLFCKKGPKFSTLETSSSIPTSNRVLWPEPIYWDN